MGNTEFGIKIVGEIVNIAMANKKNLSLAELAAILNLLGHKTAEGNEYTNPGKLVKKTFYHYSAIGDTATAENIKLVFSAVNIELLDDL